jgi:protocatechuate 3,4-dioxygenase beta subunit
MIGRATPLIVAALLVAALGAWMASPYLTRRSARRTNDMPTVENSASTCGGTGAAAKAFGVVVDQTGAPIAGVEVVWSGDKEQRTSSDSRGRFAIDPGDVVVFLSAPGYARWNKRTEKRRFVLTHERILEGRVVDGEGRGIPACTVEGIAQSAWGGPMFPSDESLEECTTDTDGRFRFARLPLCRVRLALPDPRWWAEEEVVVSSRRDVRIVVRPRGRLRGRVVDAGGKPVERAAIVDAPRLLDAADLHDCFLARSEEDGTFTVAGASGLPLTIMAVHGHERSATMDITLPIGDGSLPADLVLAPTPAYESFVRVKVVDERGRPFEGAKLTWCRRAYLPVSARRNADGTAALMPLRVDWHARVSGGYSYDSTPTTDERGEAALTVPLPPGTNLEVQVRIPAYHDSDSGLPTWRRVVSSATAPEEPLVVELKPGVKRTLRLVDPDGKDWSIMLKLAGPHRVVDLVSENRVFLLDPDVSYGVFDTSSDPVRTLDTAWRPPRRDTVTVFRAREDPDTTKHTGDDAVLRIQDSAGNPVGNATLHRVTASEPLAPFRTVGFTDLDGILRGSRVDAAFVLVAKRGLATRVVPQRSATIVLRVESRLRIRMALPDRWRTSDWRLDVRASGWPFPLHYRLRQIRTDEFEVVPALYEHFGEEPSDSRLEHTLPAGATGLLRGLPSGPCRVRLWTDRHEQSRSIRLVEGETATVEFDAQ